MSWVTTKSHLLFLINTIKSNWLWLFFENDLLDSYFILKFDSRLAPHRQQYWVFNFKSSFHTTFIGKLRHGWYMGTQIYTHKQNRHSWLSKVSLFMETATMPSFGFLNSINFTLAKWFIFTNIRKNSQCIQRAFQ